MKALCALGNIEEIELRTLLDLSAPFAADTSQMQFEPIGLLGRARAAVGKDGWDSAIAELESAASRTPADSALLGRAHAEQKNFESLKQWTEGNAASNSETADAWFARGVSAAHDQDNRRAVSYFCEAVLLDPTDDTAYFQLAASLQCLATSDGIVRTAQAQKVSQRAMSLARTREIGQQLAQSEQRNLSDLAELAKLLEDLSRPLESLSWQAVRIAYSGSNTADDVQQLQLNEINRQRMELIKNPRPATNEFVLCGIDHERIEENGMTAEKAEEMRPGD